MIFTCLALASFDAQAKELQTRVEVNTRLGTERSIAMTELWHPLAQDYGRVLYTDLRIMGDNDSNSEFNIGLGHRHITNNGSAILGVNGWFDRRQTERGSVFYQVTAGYEYLTATNDLRINTYLPFDQEEKYTLPFSGSTAPYLAGTGIFYDTAGKLVERPLRGADVEFGHEFKLPFAPDTGFRASAGAFVFGGSDVETLRGGRIRLSADITSDFEVGARFESDNVRGSQGFVEATLRFPFGAKAANDTLAIRNRLDESPERDIDIVSGSAVIDSGRMKPVISTASGQAQRVFYVDNTAAAGGNGSIERPFDTLAAANAAITRAGDIIYVYSGDGTTNNYDTHVELTRQGQALIGSGSAFVYDAGRFTASIDAGFNGTTLLAAGARPTITNTLGTCDVGACGAVYVEADDVLLSGFTAANALNDGIDIYNSSNTMIANVTTEDNGGYGLYNQAFDGQTRSFALDGFTSRGNGFHGFHIEASGAGSTWDGVTFDNITIRDSTRGLFIAANAGGIVRNVSITNSSIINQSAEAFVFNTGGTGGIENVTLSNLYAENAFNGLTLQTGGSAFIRNVDVEDFEITQSTASGIDIRGNTAQAIEDININNVNINSGTGSSNAILLRGSGTVRDVNITNSTLSSNAGAGIAVTTTHVANVVVDNVTSNNNQNGFSLTTASGGTRDNITITNFTASNNSANGLAVGTAAGGTVSNVSISSTTATGSTTGINIGGAGTLSNIDITASTANNNTNGLNASGTAAISNLTITDFTANNNSSTGLTLNPTGVGSISNSTITNTTFNQNINGVNITGTGTLSNVAFDNITTNQNQNGFAFNTGVLGTRNNITINNLTANANTTDGVRIIAGISNTVSNVTFTNSTITGNTMTGFRVSGTNSGSVTGLNVNNSDISNNTGTGVYLNTTNSSVFSGQFSDVTATGNGTHGFYFDDDSSGAYTVDLGGGALGSAGNNRIFNNTGTELRVDLDGGELKAENNWWGDVTGLQPAETTLEVGSTVDSTPFLNADPGP